MEEKRGQSVSISRKSKFQTFGEEVYLTDLLIQNMVPVDIPKATKACPCPNHHFGGHLPMPRDQAVMPYWVPRVLRTYKKIQNMVPVDIPQATKACPCPGYHFGGRLPVPRDQAVMPYWVPQVVRSYKKVVKRQQSFKDIRGKSALGRQGLVPIRMGMGRLLSSQMPVTQRHPQAGTHSTSSTLTTIRHH
ncbi:hypothetical protein HJG60_001699 [Phyllostomus discolor]|uniref:Uncharacterized protein n=1 Tax=Phyllostomus discolor TaxID=89673 RepID=A0A833YJI1_9CHIR|nr:hypothetical protein HJG60_001699 [Phyllostomus discolor]